MFCPKCGSENQHTNRFCKKCGRQLPERSQIRQAQAGGLIGHILDGKYRIDGKLGSGGMGDVYQATRLLIGDTVAIKVLHGHLARDPAAAERFRREAVTATKLRHRNVVTIFDVGIAAGYNVPYILMELAEGYSLRQFLRGGTIVPLEFAVTVTAQVCAALDEAHRLGIVHRDIKPENIIANQTGNSWQIKILDFGIAKLYDQADIGLTQDGNAMGTPQYMSPEQCMGDRIGAASDIYSVGIVLYEMLCGTVPFKGPSALAISNYQVQNAPRPPRELDSSIHPEVEAVVLRSLAKRPAERQQTASQLAKDLINAATIAYRSGLAEVSAKPIPEPAVTPDFVPFEVAAEDQAEPELIVAEGPRGEVNEILPHADVLAAGIDLTEPDISGVAPEDTLVMPPGPTPEVTLDLSDAQQAGSAPDVVEDRPKRERKPKDAAKKSRKTQAEGKDVPEIEVESVPAPVEQPSHADTDIDQASVTATESPRATIVTDKGSSATVTDVISPVEVLDAALPHAEKAVEPANEIIDLSLTLEVADTKSDELFRPEEGQSLSDGQTEKVSAATELIPPDHVPTEPDLGKVERDALPPEPERLDAEPAQAATVAATRPAVETEGPTHADVMNALPDDAPALFASTESSSRRLFYVRASVVATAFLVAISLTVWYFWPKPPPRVIVEPPPKPTLPPGMVCVPGGDFTMGSNKGDASSRPEHKVSVGAFFMDATEVTNQEYKKFVDETGHRPPPDWKNGTFASGRERFPVTGVNWEDADAYAKWAGKRLPTEAEWEFAARGSDGRLYPWGDKWDRKLANAAGAANGLREVGQGGTSPFGLYDMSGNAWEWTASDAVPYPGGRPFTSKPNDWKIIRGGCWRNPDPREVSAVHRAGWGATSESTYATTGIRCVKDLPG